MEKEKWKGGMQEREERQDREEREVAGFRGGVNLVGPWCPYMWSDIILGASVRVFLDKIQFKDVDFKESSLSNNIDGPHLISESSEQNKTGFP